jgi:hypothetical protein
MILIAAVVALSACGGAKRILNPTVQRSPVVFESDQAMSAFEAALAARYDGGAADLPPGRLSQNAFFNREIIHADTDGDGIISDAEAMRYAE